MDSDAEMIERHSRMLAGLAERAVALACALQEEALAAETAEQRLALARAFNEVSRSARQSMALEMRLRRDGRRLAEDAARADGEVRKVREGQVHQALHRMVWNEYEMDEAMDAQFELQRLIERAAQDEAFVRRPLAQVIAGIERDLRRFADACERRRQAQEADEDAEAAGEAGEPGLIRPSFNLPARLPEQDDPNLKPGAMPRRFIFEYRQPDSG